jgi:hypothetical protein
LLLCVELLVLSFSPLEFRVRATLFYLHLRSLAEVAIFFPHYSNLLIDNQEREKGKCKKKAARISKKKACAKRKAALIKIGKYRFQVEQERQFVSCVTFTSKFRNSACYFQRFDDALCVNGSRLYHGLD